MRSSLFALVAAVPVIASAQARRLVFRNLPVELSTRDIPAAVRLTDGRYHVVYSLFVTSWLDRDLRLNSLVIRGATTGSKMGDTVAVLDSAMLARPLIQRSTLFAPTNTSSPANLILRAGRTAVIQIGFTVPDARNLPSTIVHVARFSEDSMIALRGDDGSVSQDLFVTSEPTRTSRRPPLELAPPLRGGPWRCGNGLSPSNDHSALYPFRSARLRVPQRYGCDFAKVDSAGNILPNPFPNDITNAMFYANGADVLAVANGIVTYVKDGIPENVPQIDGSTRMPVPLTNETVSGNWIALQIGDSAYAFYAHLQPGSITVRVGDRVRAGKVLGRLGNSGNAVNPHLHFHVGNANTLNGSDAVPFVFQRLVFLGTARPTGQPSVRTRELPGEGAVVQFAP